MAENFGLKIEHESEKKFKSSFTEINSSFKVLESKMGLVKSQFGKNDNSISNLNCKESSLRKIN